MKAFKLNNNEYLLKLVNENELIVTLNKFNQFRQQNPRLII